MRNRRNRKRKRTMRGNTNTNTMRGNTNTQSKDSRVVEEEQGRAQEGGCVGIVWNPRSGAREVRHRVCTRERDVGERHPIRANTHDIHTSMHTYMLTRILRLIYTNTHAYLHSCTHTYTHKPTYTYKHTSMAICPSRAFLASAAMAFSTSCGVVPSWTFDA